MLKTLSAVWTNNSKSIKDQKKIVKFIVDNNYGN